MLGALGILSFAVAYVLLRLLLGRFARFALDHPNERSLHEQPVPRTGGLAVLAGALVSAPFLSAALWVALVLAVILAALSFIDDVRGLPTSVRLLCHLGAAVIVVLYLFLPMQVAALALLVLAVAWITNLFNFMDGSDGLAGGMALIGFSVYALAADAAGHEGIVAVSVALAGGAAAFLVFNFHPARIFLGDVGSVPLGFLAAAIGLAGWRDDVWPLWFPVVVFGVFIGDATLTLVKRLARRERVWQPHRSHYYQRLVRLGAGHRGTALLAYFLMAAAGAAALYGRAQAPTVQAWVVIAAVVLMGGVAAWIDVRWARHE